MLTCYFPLSKGDLGTNAKDVEAALDRNFALANRWGCILLLDEADVFLAQRTKEDFKRNGLVAGKQHPTNRSRDRTGARFDLCN